MAFPNFPGHESSNFSEGKSLDKEMSVVVKSLSTVSPVINSTRFNWHGPIVGPKTVIGVQLLLEKVSIVERRRLNSHKPSE